jgi:hypothetical protein
MADPAQTPATPDLGQHYMAYRNAAPDAAAGEALLREMESAPPAKESPGTLPQPKKPGGIGSTALSVAKDVGLGAVESTRAVYTGARDAVKNTYDMIDDFADWSTKKLGIQDVGIPIPGMDPDKKISDVARQWVDKQDIAAPKSVTGGLIKGVAQFVTGLALTRGIGPAAGGGVAATATRGAIANFAAFDPHQERLSNLVEKFPALSNPVTQLLQAKPDDTAVEGRVKNALEGLGLGAVADGFVKGVRLLKSAGEAKAAAAGDAVAGAAPAEAAPGIKDDAFAALGDETQEPGAPILQTKPGAPDSTGAPGDRAGLPAPAEGEPGLPAVRPDDLTAQQLAERSAVPGAPEQVPSTAAGREMSPPKTFINFARMDTPEDVQRAIQELADSRRGDIEGATRGAQSFEQIKLNASQQDAWNVLKSRQVGDGLNAEQSVAARQLWASSAAKLTDVAKSAVAAPTPENLFAFRKMLATHYAIQQEVIGARTETARALASWRIPVGTSESKLQDITSRLGELGGGPEVTADLARRVSNLADSTSPNAALQLDKMVEKGAWARTRDAVIQFWSDALLTSPVTQARILASNVSTTIWRMGERKVAEGISSLLNTKNGIAPGEAAAQWNGIVGGWKDALAYAWNAAKTGTTGEGIGEPHAAFPSNITAEALHLSDQGWMGKGVDLLGTAVSLGRRGIAAQHDAALTLAYRMELNAQSLRQATSELNAGEIEESGLGERVAQLVANPPDGMVDASRTAAKYQAFLDEPGHIAQLLLDARQKVPALRIIMPFIKIPARIMSFTFERTPLAPLMSDFRSKIAAGGATRDLALAQVGLGTAITMAAADMTMSGQLKGGGPPEIGLSQAQDREGMKRDSVKIGDTWYGINGVHPVGKLMLLAADVAEAVKGGQTELHDDADTEKLAVGTALSIGRTLTNASYMQGVANFFAMVHDAKVGGAGENAILSTVGSAVPSVVSAIDRAGDPYQRAVYTMLDEFKSKIPGLSQTLPPKRDLWGDPVSSGHDALTKLASPVGISPEKHNPIDDEILKQGFNITIPGKNQSFNDGSGGVQIDMSKYPKAYSRFLQLAGHEYQSPAWGMGAKDLLNQVVSGVHPLSQVYDLKSDGPGGGKEMMIRDLMSQFRDGAKRQLLDEYPAIQNEVDTKRAQMQALKLGNM